MIKLGMTLIKWGLIIVGIGAIIAAAIGFPLLLVIIIPAVISFCKSHKIVNF